MNKNFYSRTCFIFRSTSSDQLSVRDIFLPLSTTVWYLTIAISILSINALAFLLLFTRQDFYENYLHSIIIHVGAFCQQGISVLYCLFADVTNSINVSL